MRSPQSSLKPSCFASLAKPGKEARFLVTTADERTWKFDRPVIFLGEWCRLYHRRQVWSKMDAVVAEPYGLDQGKKDQDEAQVRKLEAELFPSLCNVLNRHHGTTHGERFWNIVLGHWLRTYMSTLANRFKTLESCLDAHEIAGTAVIADNGYSLATLDSLSATLAANDDPWNHALYHQILSRLGRTGLRIDVLELRLGSGFRRPEAANAVPLKRRLLRLARSSVSAAARSLMKESDAMIIGSYLPLLHEIRLQLALGQAPQLWRPQALDIASPRDPELRRALTRKVERRTNDRFVDFIHAMVFELLPVCYLEGFAELSDQVGRLSWPRNPKFIFTSNNFDSDELFKLWAARKAEAGTRYIAGQHGGNYGSRRIPHRSVEEETADRFLTWGWTEGLPQHRLAFLLNTAGRGKPRKKPDPDGRILLVQECLNHRIPVWDDIGEFAKRWADLLVFMDSLKTDARSRLTVRLHPSFRQLSWSDLERLRDFDANLDVDTGDAPIEQAIARSRMLVFSYDSSGFYEALSQDIPTIAFWHTGLDFLRDSAKPVFRTLIDAGIFHVTPESAAQRINEISDDVLGWWAKPAIQEARMQFCNRYARITQEPILELKRILLSEN